MLTEPHTVGPYSSYNRTDTKSNNPGGRGLRSPYRSVGRGLSIRPDGVCLGRNHVLYASGRNGNTGTAAQPRTSRYVASVSASIRIRGAPNNCASRWVSWASIPIPAVPPKPPSAAAFVQFGHCPYDFADGTHANRRNCRNNCELRFAERMAKVGLGFLCVFAHCHSAAAGCAVVRTNNVPPPLRNVFNDWHFAFRLLRCAERNTFICRSVINRMLSS